MNIIKQHPYIFWGIIIFLILLVISIFIYYFYYSSSSASSASTSSTASSGTASSGTASTTASSGTASTTPTSGSTSATPTSGSTSTGSTTASASSSFVPMSGCTFDPNAPNYSFCQGEDSGGNDIGNQSTLYDNVPGLVSYCDSLPNCAGFNTNAWVKSSILPQAQWSKWTTDPSKGLYVKGSERFTSFNPFNILSKMRYKKAERFVPSGFVGNPMMNPFNP